MKAYILQADYNELNEKTIVKLFGKLESGKSFASINIIEPYFFIKQDDSKKLKPYLSKYQAQETSLTNFAHDKVLKISHPLQSELNKLISYLHESSTETYEADIKPHQRFLIDNDILGSIDIKSQNSETLNEAGQRVDVIFSNPEISPSNFVPSLKVLSIDIESDENSDKLFCIGLHSKDYEKVFMITDKKLSRAVSCKNELECLNKFKEEIIKLDPDVITGWNIAGFDFPFLKKCCERNKISFDIARDNSETRIRVAKDFFKKSSVTIAGRQVLDALSLIKDPFIKEAPSIKNIDIESWTLEDVSQALLKEGKLIIGKDRHEKIQELYESKSQASLQKLADYNLQDARLAYLLLEKTKTIELAIERSQLTGLQLDRITGSIAAFDSLYIREARKRSLVSPTTHYTNKEERIKGGFVRESNPGIYHDLLVLDFKSLYPSIIKTFNIDPSSHIENPSKHHSDKLIRAPNNVYFTNTQGILPDIISKLHEAREKAKHEKRELSSYAIKIIQNSFFGVLASPNCRYFSLDVANAITHFGQYIIKLTAEKIESRGYRVIYSDSVDGKTKIILKKGDKVFENEIENIFTKEEKEIEEKEYDLKKDLEVLTLDEDGKSVFKPIKYVMRHKCNKKMYRVHFTNNWHIDVTEDHSLMGYQSLAFNSSKRNKDNPLVRIIEIKPNEIKTKANTIISLKKIPYEKEESRNYPKEIYEFMGYFIGDGSFHRNKMHKKYNKDYYLGLSLGSDKEEILNKLIIPLKNKGYIKNYWISKTRNGDIRLNGLKLIEIITKNLRDNKNKKIIPEWLFNEKEENIASFLRGLFSADGCVMMRHNAPLIKYTSIEEEYIKSVRKLLYRLGISNTIFKENSLNVYKTKDKIYSSGSYSKNILIKDKDNFCRDVGFIIDRKNTAAKIKSNALQKRHIKDFEFDIQAVKRVEEIESPKYVYDIEVDKNHRFFANYVLVHNTDSIFIDASTHKKDKKEIGKEIQENINDFYKHFVKKEYNRESFLELEFKRHYLAFLMPTLRSATEKGSKKRYAGLYINNGKEELEIVGMEAIRGDWTDAAQEFQRELLLKVFKREEFIKFIKDYVKKLKDGKLDSKLVYRKSIRKSLEKYTKTTPPHVKAARQLDSLESNEIEYYITERGPEPIQKLKHKLDYNHYIDKQIAPIANTVLFFFNRTFEDILKESKQTKLFN